jgi:hypothetical protein
MITKQAGMQRSHLGDVASQFGQQIAPDLPSTDRYPDTCPQSENAPYQ